MKKKLPTHDDTPSKPLEPKIIESEAPNYEGDVRGTKYEVDENRPVAEPLSPPKSKSIKANDYPLDDIDIYAVDTRIWDRIGEMGGDGGGPHTHDTYATKTELSDGLAGKSDDPHTHNYADATHTHPEYEGGSGEGYDDSEVRGLIQDNTDALDGKSDTTHTHDTTHNHDGDYAPTSHDHTQYVKGEGATGLAMWIGSQADYDAIVSKRLTTLYVVM